MTDLDTILQALKKRLKTNRYEHTLRVIDYGKTLAEIHKVSSKQVIYAAALHDFCKNTSDQEIINCLKEHMPEAINEIILNKPNLGHGHMAALMVKDWFSVEDQVIINAIKHHTFGSKEISTVGKIVYLADHLEPDRNFIGVDTMRKLVKVDLNEALILASSQTLTYEISLQHMLHEDTLQMRNFLISKRYQS
jgi:predicted HD superfamily hydrolase involved in NAD metabolism